MRYYLAYSLIGVLITSNAPNAKGDFFKNGAWFAQDELDIVNDK